MVALGGPGIDGIIELVEFGVFNYPWGACCPIFDGPLCNAFRLRLPGVRTRRNGLNNNQDDNKLVEIWTYHENHEPVGFIGLNGTKIEAFLFIRIIMGKASAVDSSNMRRRGSAEVKDWTSPHAKLARHESRSFISDINPAATTSWFPRASRPRCPEIRRSIGRGHR